MVQSLANPELKLHEILFKAQTKKSKTYGSVLQVKLRAGEHAKFQEAASKAAAALAEARAEVAVKLAMRSKAQQRLAEAKARSEAKAHLAHVSVRTSRSASAFAGVLKVVSRAKLAAVQARADGAQQVRRRFCCNCNFDS
jgi:hypothetical protein